MCEIFPEVEKCCMCISIRLAMVFIGVLAIMTGVIMLCMIEKQSNASYKNLKNITDLEKVRDVNEVLNHLGQIVPSGITLMGVIFIVCGLLVLFGNFVDQEGFVQVFVWLTFLNILVGFVMIIAVAVQCMHNTKLCLLKHMDWLSGSASLVLFVFYLCLWIYFISVANTYVVNVYQ